MSFLSAILPAHPDLCLTSWVERWEKCRDTPRETACLRTIASDADGIDNELSTYCHDAARASGEDRALWIADIERIFAEYAAQEQFDHDCAMFEHRTGKLWEYSPELRARAANFMPGVM
ncbi:hypothetical protein [Qipengyuania sp. MTN3-11]|uniref:hypothetical protein n=1 Tax=Qipengyuania sp. MTN3-11 TaxID=3056557 RepID=UPI0036F40BC4